MVGHAADGGIRIGRGRTLTMRGTTLALLLAAVCLLAAPCVAPAQTSAVTPMQGTAQPGRAGAGAPEQPLAWSSLSPGQQRMLAPLQGQWDQLHPQRQHRFAQNAMHWATLPPEHQQQIQERLTRWAGMTPEQRLQWRENARAFHNLTPEERARVSAAFRRFQSLSPAERRALRERWRTMPPEQRMRWANEHPGKPMPMNPPARRGH
ncbi:MAG: DUF3106 domain-containing protein [Rhodanobacteraceae bacterium]|nr:MAG: DUF3106 domain-containing protein [Rhodanobacteraceae bacterium]